MKHNRLDDLSKDELVYLIDQYIHHERNRKIVVTPAAVDEYFNVTSTAFIIVPRGCSFDISVENVSEPADATTPAPAINAMNCNLVIQRVA